MINRSHNIITSLDQLREVVSLYLTFDAFAFDTETRGVNPVDTITNEVYWVSLAGPGVSHSIPVGHKWGVLLEPSYKTKEAWWDDVNRTKTGKPRKKWRTVEIPAVWSDPPEQLRPAQVFRELEPLFFNKNNTLVGHNVKFDVKSITKYYRGRVPLGPYVDTQVIQQIINENLPKKGLKELTKHYFRFTYEDLGKALGTGEVPFSAAGTYSRLDAKYTWLLYRKLRRILKRQRLEHILELDMEMLEACTHAELRGITIDQARLNEADTRLLAEIETVKAELYREAGEIWNVNSAPQKAVYVYDILGHTATKYTDGGKRSVDKGVLEHIAKRDERVGTLVKYTELEKLHGTYVAGAKKQISPLGRVHTTFNLYRAVTGRLSSSEPNLQNIPAPGNPNSTTIRSMYVAAPGKKLVVSDFGQIEYRVMADLSQDETYARMFMETDTDPHVLTAMQLFGLSRENVTKQQRTVAKNTGFAIAYGAGPDKVAAMSGVNLLQAKQVMSRHQQMFPGLYDWMREALREARRRTPPYFETKMGRRRRLPGLLSPDFKERSHCERQGINHMVQGSAAEIMKQAFVRLHVMLEPSMGLLLTVHDEVVVETPIDEVEVCRKIVDEAMTGEEIQRNWSVPIVTNTSVVDSWDQAK